MISVDHVDFLEEIGPEPFVEASQGAWVEPTTQPTYLDTLDGGTGWNKLWIATFVESSLNPMFPHD